MKILLNDILNLKNLENVKIRFNKPNLKSDDFDPIKHFKEDKEKLFEGHFGNYKKKKSFKEGQIAIGFAEMGGDQWLLFDISKITKDLNKFERNAYEHKTLEEYEKYFGRLIVKFKNEIQQMIRNAESVIGSCEVIQILPDTFDNDIFPGYDKVNISWEELSRVLEKENWKTALKNQKGVYLITDTSNGKRYVGSAYGKNMLLGRWESYKNTGHGGNVGLKELTFDYIKTNFRYSILDIYKSTIDDNVIIERENWWKDLLLSRNPKFGYNGN